MAARALGRLGTRAARYRRHREETAAWQGRVPATRRRLAPAMAALVLLAACASSAPERPELTFSVPLETTYDLASARPLSDEALLARLDGVHLLFLGEHHTDARSHDFQLRVLRALVRQGRPVTVGLEMFPPEADGALDDWRDGRLSEQEFLERSQWYRTWGFPWDYYRPLFLLFREARITVRGLNAAPATRQAVHRNAMAELPPAVLAEIDQLETPEPQQAYLRWALQRAGHDVPPGNDSPRFQQFWRVQALWDRLIGLRAARLAEAQPARGIVAVLVGSGHLEFKLGANLQAARVSPVAQLSVVDRIAGRGQLDQWGHYPLPLGLGDVVRVYAQEAQPPELPSLAGVKLKDHGPGVQVEAIDAFAVAPPRGLQAGDIIVSLDGQPVRSEIPLRLAYERLPPGAHAAMDVLRSERTVTLSIAIPKSAPDAARDGS